MANKKTLKKGQKSIEKTAKTSEKQVKIKEKPKKAKKTTTKSNEKKVKNVVGMRVPNKTEKLLIKETIQFMTELQIYKPQYIRLIEMYASLLFLYNKLYTEFSENDYKVVGEETNKAGFTNERKTGNCLAIEKLREEIFKTQHIIGLTPVAIKRLKDDSLEKQTNSLGEILQRVYKNDN